MNIGNLFYNNKFIILFSIFASFAAWCVFSVSTHSRKDVKSYEEKLIRNVPVEVEAKDGYEVMFAKEGDKRVDVYIEADRITNETLGPKDIKITAEPTIFVSGPGIYDMRLRPEKNNRSYNYKVKSVYPETIRVAIDKKEQRQFDIENGIEYKVEDGFFAEKPHFTPEKTVIKGPKFIVDKISKVIATGRIEEVMNKPQETETFVEIYDENNRKVSSDFLEINSLTPKASVSVLRRKSVPVSVKYENGPSDEAFLDSILKKSSESVEIVGVGSNLENIKEVKAVVDFSTINGEDKIIKAKLESNTQQYEFDSYDKIKLTLNTENLSRKKITCANFEDKDNIEINKKPIVVEIVGPKKSLENLDSKNIKIVPNLKINTNVTGEQQIEAKVQISQNSDCWAFGKYTVYAKIQQS